MAGKKATQRRRPSETPPPEALNGRATRLHIETVELIHQGMALRGMTVADVAAEYDWEPAELKAFMDLRCDVSFDCVSGAL